MIYLDIMYNKCKNYIVSLLKALIGKPIVTVEQVDHIVVQPISGAQMKYLEDLFKLPVYKEGMSLTELANATGKYEVVEFLKWWSERGYAL